MTEERETAALLAEFRHRAEPLGVAVDRVNSIVAASRAIAEWATLLGADRVIVVSELIATVPEFRDGLEERGLQVMSSRSPEETRDAPLGVSLARLAIAETGSLLLSEPSLADRSVGMLTLAHAVICPTSALVASLDDAVSELRALSLTLGGSFSTLVTGPSRTADIERVLTVGVQGPGKIMTLFVDAL